MNIYYVQISQIQRKKPYNRPLIKHVNQRKRPPFIMKEWIRSWKIWGAVKILCS
jgi:hypothetical protein